MCEGAAGARLRVLTEGAIEGAAEGVVEGVAEGENEGAIEGVGCFLGFDIVSRENAKIKYVKKLVFNDNFRKRDRCFAAEGLRLCYDAFLSGVLIDEIYYTDEAAEKFSKKIGELINYARRAYCVPGDVLKEISDTKTPQGVVCVCEKLDKQFSLNTISSENKIIVLEDIQDPRNLGTILRTAEALGMDFIVLSKGCCDVYNPKVLRGSMGAAFRVKAFFADEICDAIECLKKVGFKVLAAVPDESASFITGINLGGRTAVVIGNEGNGLTQGVVDVCSQMITIPMRGRAESLNAAMAAGILMWEMMREVRG